MNQPNRRRRIRSTSSETVPVKPLPPENDTLWTLGPSLAQLVVDFVDSEGR